MKCSENGSFRYCVFSKVQDKDIFFLKMRKIV